MDFYKFKNLLNTKCLFFTRIDEYDDLFEGRSSDKLHSLFELYKKRTYANCWNQNDYESNLMWEVYTKDKENKGIAIKSSFARLCNCFEDYKYDQYIGKVTYDNSDLLPENNTLIPFFRKKQEFKSEKEIRAICQIIDIQKKNPEKGIRVKVNLTELIESIYTSPSSSPDFINEVQKIIKEFKLEKPIKTSELLYRSNTIRTNKKYPQYNIKTKSYIETDVDSSGNVKLISNEQNIDGPQTVLITVQKKAK